MNTKEVSGDDLFRIWQALKFLADCCETSVRETLQQFCSKDDAERIVDEVFS